MKFVTGIPKRTCSEACSHPVTNNYSRGSHRHLRRGAGLSPSTERHSASQATSGSKQSGHAVDGGAARAAISWASLHHGTAGEVVQTSATRHVVARLSPSRSTSVARQRGASSRRAASQRRGSGDHTPGRKCMCDCTGGAVLKKNRRSQPMLRVRATAVANARDGAQQPGPAAGGGEPSSEPAPKRSRPARRDVQHRRRESTLL